MQLLLLTAAAVELATRVTEAVGLVEAVELLAFRHPFRETLTLLHENERLKITVNWDLYFILFFWVCVCFFCVCICYFIRKWFFYTGIEREEKKKILRKYFLQKKREQS